MTDIRLQKDQGILSIRLRSHPPGMKRANSLNNKRILLVSPMLPFPPESGGRQRTYFLWKALSEIAPADVVVCSDLLNSGATAASMPASVNVLGRFPWRAKGHSVRPL